MFLVRISTPSFVNITNSLSFRKYTSLVWLKTAGISEAIKYSFCPMPTIKGLSFFTAISLSGSFLLITPMAKLPSSLAVALITESNKSPL